MQFRNGSRTIPKNLHLSLHCKIRPNTVFSIRLSFRGNIVSIMHIYASLSCVW